MTRTKKIRNRKAILSGKETILSLTDHGFKVEQLSPYQFRINDQLDLYPTNKRYHDVIRGTRGDYWNITVLDICRRILI